MIPYKKREFFLEETILKRNTLVIIDDDNFSLDVLKFFSESFFNNIYTFNSTEAALPFILNNQIDLIICDYFIPDKRNGYELASILKQKGINIPFILASGQSSEIDSDDNLINVDCYLEKPYVYSDFIEKINL